MERIINLSGDFKQRLPLVLFCLLWGIAIASSISYLLESYISQIISISFLFFVVAVPIIEESTKISGLFFCKKWMNNRSSIGFLLGVSVGIGFAITETIIYGLRYNDQPLPVIIAFLFIRLLGAGSMHALSTGLLGYGYSEYINNNRSVTYLTSFLICAIGVHALFNLMTFSAQVYDQVFLIILSVMFSLILILAIRKKIYLNERNKIYSNLIQ